MTVLESAVEEMVEQIHRKYLNLTVGAKADLRRDMMRKLTPLFRHIQPELPFTQGEAEKMRVAHRLGTEIVFWCKRRMEAGKPQFHGEELRKFIFEEKGIDCAPASPDRILRYLRACGVVGYKCLSRRESLYELTATVMGNLAKAMKDYDS